jgi:hypothetical protein
MLVDHPSIQRHAIRPRIHTGGYLSEREVKPGPRDVWREALLYVHRAEFLISEALYIVNPLTQRRRCHIGAMRFLEFPGLRVVESLDRHRGPTGDRGSAHRTHSAVFLAPAAPYNVAHSPVARLRALRRPMNAL